MTKKATVRIEPLGARVLVQPLEGESRTPSGIILPESAKEKPQTGLVIAIGGDESIKVKVDDKVLYAKYTGAEIKLDGIEYLLMDQNDILARMN